MYEGAKCTKLGATILLMNVCIVYGVGNNFANELFMLLQGRILLQGNTLLKNFYSTRRLTNKLGLAYNSIYACEKGCVLFKGELEGATHCPKYNGLRYKDEIKKKF